MKIFALIMAAALAWPVQAQQTRAEASVDDIVNALTPPPRTRSLSRNL